MDKKKRHLNVCLLKFEYYILHRIDVVRVAEENIFIRNKLKKVTHN